MNKLEDKSYEDLDIKLTIGNLNLSVFYLRYVPPISNWKSPNHCHSSYELHYIPSGHGILTINQNKYKIIPGTFYLTGPGVYHEQISAPKEPMSEFCINFDYKILKTNIKDGVPKQEVEGLINALKNSYFWFGSDEHKDIALFEKIFYELENQFTGYYTIVRNYLTQIIINMLRYFIQQKATYSIPRKSLDDVRKQTLDNLLYTEFTDITMAKLANSISVSPRQLDRIMKQFYSMSFKQKLLNIRIDNAIYLLKSTNLTIDEICKQTGFNSSSYFCRVIKKRNGITANEYRSSNNS
jgi:AraC-like DNA-binding protein